jgi:hypothetical protein
MAAAQTAPLPAQEIANREERRAAIESAWGTTLAEGVSPGPEVWALSERYIEGELTLEQLGAAVRAIDGL